MANLRRTARPGGDWTRAELDAYNIAIIPQTKAEFFETNDFPDPADPSLLGFMTNEFRQTTTDKKTKQLLHYLDLAMDPKVGQELAVGNFAGELFRALDYDDNDRIVFIRLFSSAGRTRWHKLTFASWIMTKFCYCYKRVRG